MDVLTIFLKENNCPSIIVDENFIETDDEVIKSKDSFIFINNITGVDESIDQIRGYTFWSSRSHNHFIICSSVDNTNFLPNLLQTIWENRIVNFVVVFVFDFLQIFSFNPFKNEMLNLTRRRRNFFPNKVKNLYGHQLRVSLWADWPLTVHENGEWSGDDYEMLQLVMEMVNATLAIVEPPSILNYAGLIKDVQTNNSDFCFTTFFLRQKNETPSNIECSYPHEKNEFVVLIPYDSNHIKKTTVMSIFYPSVWATFTVLLILTALVSSFSQQSIRHFIKFFLYSFGVVIGSVFPFLQKRNLSLKVNVIVFIWNCIVFRTAFQSFLISTSMTPSSYVHIKTIPELRDSQIQIRATRTMINLIPRDYNLQEQIVPIDLNKRQAQLKARETSAAFLINSFKAEKLIVYWKNLKSASPFYMMQQALLPGSGTFIFQKHSPYLDTINECLQFQKQFGLSKEKTGHDKTRKTEGGVVPLSLKHLQFIFSVLVWGLVVAFFVFLGEIIHEKIFVSKTDLGSF
ncbi:hypothetical protein Zmor_007463 [Zophobas morio]|uniref:Uncharacterized protein n=1 Tax=Zophobas morio TaxID=2755281 RepID=A0AA38MPF7_9CUCU|nr:hypothetical protein Zmor_007463 [Zophobas morio]